MLAGPGTGKTHILSARIGHILRATDTQANNILCLTYTDAGANAMRKRLLQFIGPESHKVHIFTFHSFCNQIVKENLSLFGLQDLEIATELERIEIIRELIDELPTGHTLKNNRYMPYLHERKLLKLFDLMKSENWTVEGLHQAIGQHLEDIMTHPDYRYKRKHREFKKGDLKLGEIRKIEKQMETLHEAARLFPKYLIGLRKRQRYDFADMLRWVRDAFDQYPDLLRRYQEQYLYFLIDEFQDTNGIQLEVLEQLIGFWKNPNVFAVGDDDQSIFEFQGARIKNVKDFYDKFEQHIKVVVLTENYRSVQDILDAAKILIDHNELRLIRQLGQLDLEKTLRSANPGFSKLNVKPELLQYPQRLQEELSIVERIEQLRQEGQELHEIAVLFAKHRQSATLIRLLDRKGIPYQTKKRVNILKLPVIRNVITLFEYLDKELQFPYSGEELLFKLLHFPFWEIKAIDLAKLSLWRAKNWQSARAIDEYKSPETCLNLIQNQELL
ncbi:MAG: ATP-dependent helicase, partial [Bacteroidota bacterium]